MIKLNQNSSHPWTNGAQPGLMETTLDEWGDAKIKSDVLKTYTASPTMNAHEHTNTKPRETNPTSVDVEKQQNHTPTKIVKSARHHHKMHIFKQRQHVNSKPAAPRRNAEISTKPLCSSSSSSSNSSSSSIVVVVIIRIKLIVVIVIIVVVIIVVVIIVVVIIVILIIIAIIIIVIMIIVLVIIVIVQVIVIIIVEVVEVEIIVAVVVIVM